MAKQKKEQRSINLNPVLWDKVEKLRIKYNISLNEAIALIIQRSNVDKIKYC